DLPLLQIEICRKHKWVPGPEREHAEDKMTRPYSKFLGPISQLVKWWNIVFKSWTKFSPKLVTDLNDARQRAFRDVRRDLSAHARLPCDVQRRIHRGLKEKRAASLSHFAAQFENQSHSCAGFQPERGTHWQLNPNFLTAFI